MKQIWAPFHVVSLFMVSRSLGDLEIARKPFRINRINEKFSPSLVMWRPLEVRRVFCSSQWSVLLFIQPPHAVADQIWHLQTVETRVWLPRVRLIFRNQLCSGINIADKAAETQELFILKIWPQGMQIPKKKKNPSNLAFENEAIQDIFVTWHHPSNHYFILIILT